MSVEKMYAMKDVLCSCGKTHSFSVKLVMGQSAVSQVPEIVKGYGVKKAFLLSDVNTYKAAGEQVCILLQENGIADTGYSFPEEAPEPDERTVGAAVTPDREKALAYVEKLCR